MEWVSGNKVANDLQCFIAGSGWVGGGGGGGERGRGREGERVRGGGGWGGVGYLE